MNSNKIIYSAAIGNGIANTIINGAITWFTFKSMTQVPFSLDSISNKEVTVFGTMFPVVLGLTFILGIITFFTFKKTAEKEKLADLATINKPFFPDMIKFIFGRTLAAFGFMMVVAVLFQRILGTIITTSLMATVIVGLTAGLAAAYIGISVSKEVIRKN